MAGDQLPVLTLDFDDEKIKALQDISEQFKAAFSVGPGGFPIPQPLPPAHPEPHPGSDGKKPEVQSTFDKFMKSLNKDAQGTLKTFTLINKTLGATTSTLKGLFTETVSWGARIAAIGGGGLFGYGFMAQHVSNQYKSSQGLAITTGQMQAAHNVYGSRISGTGNIMQALAAAQNDPTSANYAGLVNMGINPQEGAAANMPQLLSRVSQLLQQYKGTGVSQTALKANGLDGLIDVATANQVLANSDRLPQLNQQFSDQSQRLDRDMGSGTQQNWQDLSARFMANADSIGNTFLNALAKLNGPMRRISDELTVDIEKFLNGRNGKALFDTLANGLEKLGKWLGSDDFQHDLDTFSTAVKNVAAAIGDVITWIAGNVPGVNLNGTGVGVGTGTDKDTADPALVNFGKKYLNGNLPYSDPGTNQYTSIFPANKVYEDYRMPGVLKDNIQNFVNQTNDTYGLPKGLMAGIAQRESSWNPLAKGKANSRGEYAAGLFQFMPETAKTYGLSDVDRYDPNKETAAAGKYLHDLMTRYKGNLAEVLTTYNGGHVGKDGTLSLKMETVKYLQALLPKEADKQNPNIMHQLKAAHEYLDRSPAGSTATIKLMFEHTPGSEISPQVKGIYNTPR
ncbi:TPA: lytic transglycosylase domain-containing protein [Enterobacter ludwigii]|uniref:lytic transglycosylase domain-containing protein n=1 Tax=Enterobacter TaxID=547 RepID=UPI0022CA5961|nr:lytic transglycosylase domain-containing protein [Enterobacter sp. 200527-13]GLH24095.1 hypothetical protein ENT52713_14910 [Enterobacter sp. 200527-13]HDR2588914.1 lytic transglycosylase domain-containing protein [Enterobacter ludwigii]HDR2598882.1 lytic transglycosylase domain-containing protein [Enterobacter ludwigii]